MSRYFDGVFCISLARRAQRWRSLRERLRRWGIEAERIEAVDGGELAAARRQPTAPVPSVSPSLPLSISPSPPRSVSPSLAHLSPGELGCLVSHRKAIELARARDYRTVLVLEDDVCFHRRFDERLKELEAIGDGWDLLYLGASQYERRGRKFLNPHCYRARKTLGTFAYAMRATMFEQFLALGDVLDAPVDAALVRLQDDPANRCLVCDPPLAVADVRESDIRPERDLERHAARLGWRLEEFEVPEKAEGRRKEADRSEGADGAPAQGSEAGGQCKMQNEKCKMQNDASGSKLDYENLCPKTQDLRPNASAENPKSLECRYRSLDDRGTARCDHPCVHAPDGIVTLAVCQSCALREEP
ncbi:MAG: glycosyltransferase family 25 protein [Pirellulales bacterium]